MVTWHIMDDTACPVCKQMNGYTWVFEVGQNELNGVLEHSASPNGIAWTVAEGSRAHGGGGHCRCWITYEVDFQDLIVKANQILAEVKEIIGAKVLE